MVRRWWGAHVTSASILYFYHFQYLAFCSFFFFVVFTVFVHLLNIHYSIDHSTLMQTEICSTHITFFFLFLQFNSWKQSTPFPSCYIHIFFEFWDFLIATFSVICKCFCMLKFFSFVLERIHFITWGKFLLYILFK